MYLKKYWCCELYTEWFVSGTIPNLRCKRGIITSLEAALGSLMRDLLSIPLSNIKLINSWFVSNYGLLLHPWLQTINFPYPENYNCNVRTNSLFSDLIFRYSGKLIFTAEKNWSWYANERGKGSIPEFINRVASAASV